MPQTETNRNSEYNQASFVGGMNLLLDDTHLASNQYRVGFNLRNRYDRLDCVPKSQKDMTLPSGVIQEIVTFGNYVIAFVAGKAYYKLFTSILWHPVDGFSMDPSAPRYWTEQVPVATTNYLRIAATGTVDTKTFTSVEGAINLLSVASASSGNLPGLLVQDNINQPQFIFLAVGANGYSIVPTCRTTQNYSQWSITFTDADNTTVAADGDKREYVPIGNAMKFLDGILYIVSKDQTKIYRSVSGRPLDFVVNVKNTLATSGPPYTMTGGGDADTTSYSVGAGPITALKALSDESLFVAAGSACFSVAKNMSNIAPKIFGEWTFVRKFLFNAVCLSDRAYIDTLGDTRFIDLTGVRSFNAIEQLQNQGRNSPFTANIQSAFDNIIQQPQYAAAVLFNNFEFYAVDTIFGPCIAVYDTITNCWVGFDTTQTEGKRIKQFAKIELTTLALFAITEDNCLYRLYVGPGTEDAMFRTVGVCSSIQYAGENVKLANPKMEVKLTKTRVIHNLITEDCELTFTPFVNNRLAVPTVTKNIKFVEATPKVDGRLSDVNTMLVNHCLPTPNCPQGWKVFAEISWNKGSITQFSMELMDITPQNPLNSQK